MYKKLEHWLNSGSLSKVYREFDNNFVRFNNSFISNLVNNYPEIVYNTLLKNVGNKERNIFLLAKFSLDKKYFKKVFEHVIDTIDDLYCFLYYVSKVRGFGRTIRTCVINWFHRKNTYELKLFSAYQCQGFGWSFRDVLKEFHIKPKNKPEEELFYKVINNYCDEKNETFLECIERYETLKQLDDHHYFYYKNKLNNFIINNKLKILHIIEDSTLFEKNVINSKLKMKWIIKNAIPLIKNSYIINIDNEEIWDIDRVEFNKKSERTNLTIEENYNDFDIIFVWSDRRNIKIKTNKKVVKIHLDISRITNKKEEDNVYKILGFNNNTIELISNILKGKI